MIYKPAEAAKYLGIDLKTLKEATYKGQIGYLRISPKRTLYPKADLDAFRANWRRVPVAANAPRNIVEDREVAQ